MPGKSREEAFDQLLEHLRGAKISYEARQDKGRLGAINALDAVVDFLNSFEAIRAEQLALPILAVSAALEDLDDGAEAPMFIASKKSGRPFDSFLLVVGKGLAAAMVDALMDQGQSRDSACQKVANVLNRVGFRPQRGNSETICGRTVRYWRERAHADVQRREIGTQAYYEWLELVKPVATYRNQTRHLLKILEDLVSSWIPSPKKPVKPPS